MNIADKAAQIKLLLMDCDGVLTDGRITLMENSDEQKSFHTRDGHGIVLFHRAGLSTGIITGRTSTVVERRAKELGIKYLHQGQLNKPVAYEQIIAESGFSEIETAFIGDDVTDIPLMRRSGLGIAVADATEETRMAADYITTLPGGFGAVREAVEIILKAQLLWTDLMRRYLH
jgi:3-deoxy-D-manno-octulosonate 8-phosphate phosphatase (KDO 8-P phosphatase)